MRAHLYKTLTDDNGAVVLNCSVAVYQPGTTTPIVDTMWTDDTTEINTVDNPQTSTTGVVDFYLDVAQRVDLGVTPEGSAQVIFHDIDVLEVVDAGAAEFKGAWSSSVTYSLGDLVIGSDEFLYASNENSNLNNDPTTNPGTWTAPPSGGGGSAFRGAWDSGTTYATGDLVAGTDNEFLYASLVDGNLDNDPAIDDGSNWTLAPIGWFTDGAQNYWFDSTAAASGGQALAIGIAAVASAANATAVGSGQSGSGHTGVTTASATGTVAVGSGAQATQAGAVAVGLESEATGTDSTAIGGNAAATHANTVALGNGAASGHANDATIKANTLVLQQSDSSDTTQTALALTDSAGVVWYVTVSTSGTVTTSTTRPNA